MSVVKLNLTLWLSLQAFREQGIDGSTLVLLTEDHFVDTFKMSLGPALKLRKALARKMAFCDKCNHCKNCHEEKDGEGENEPPSTKDEK